MVYGFGIVFLLLVKRYFLDKLKINGFKKIIITFLASMITLTFIEWLGGSILYQLFHINLWDYSKKSIHFGKYICLDLALVWGTLGTLYLYYFKNITDKIIAIITPKTTASFLIINLIDTIFVFINKFVYWK